MARVPRERVHCGKLFSRPDISDIDTGNAAYALDAHWLGCLLHCLRALCGQLIQIFLDNGVEVAGTKLFELLYRTYSGNGAIEWLDRLNVSLSSYSGTRRT